MTTLNRKALKREDAQNDARANWLGEHGIELLVVATSMFTAACFCIGRANLMGWYDAAGIPALTFSWAPQDLVIRGLLHSRTWWLMICSIGGALLYFATLASLAFAYRRLRPRWRSSRMGIWLTGGERDVSHEDARNDASEMGVSCELLTEGDEQARHPSPPKAAERTEAALYVLAIAVLLLAASAFIFGNTVLFAEPYSEGANSFRGQFLAATGHAAPRRGFAKVGGRQVIASIASNAPLADAFAVGLRELEGYAYVEVSSMKDGGANDPRVCGWLVQSSGNQILLLTVEGISMTYFGDSAFAWRMVDPESCSIPRFSARPAGIGLKAGGATSEAPASRPVNARNQTTVNR